MVKMRLRRIGTKGRPFYRVVVAPSTSGRNGRFVEVLGTYDPVSRPAAIKINEERALFWLMEGAQPTETMAIVLNRSGVLEKFFDKRPAARGDYKFLDKTTGLTSKVSAVTTTPVAPAPKAEPKPEPTPEPVSEPEAEPIVAEEATAEVAEAPAETEAPAEAEAPAEEAVAEEVVAEAEAAEPELEAAEAKTDEESA